MVSCPIIAADDYDAVAFLVRGSGDVKPEDLRIIRIIDTLHVTRILVSPAVLADCK